MTQDAITVFGISLGEHLKGGFAFVDVVATVEDRKLKPVPNPREQFATEGNVYVDKSQWIPERGVGAVWKVRQTRTPPEGQRHAAFSAVGRGQAGPLEIIFVPAMASRPDDVRRLLMTGIGLGYTPGASVLIQTKEGVVIGPVRCDHSDPVGRAGVLVKAEALSDLLGRWDRGDDLMPLLINWHGHRRVFTSLLDLPAAIGFFDCADLSDCVRAVLRFASATKIDGLSLTKKQVDALATALAGDDTPPRIAVRSSRVIDALRMAVNTAGELDVVTEFLRMSGAVQSELERIRQEARLDEQRRIDAEESEAKAKVADLVRKERDARDRLAEVERQLKEAGRKAQALVDGLIHRMRQRVVETKRDAPEAFANAALLQVLLRTSQEEVVLAGSDRVREGKDVPLLASPSDALARLEAGLRSTGLVQGSARAAARETLATALAGQLLTFSGSLGSVLCEVVAQTFSGTRVFRLSIPVGLLSSAGCTRCLEEALAESQASGTLTSIIIQGINRSPLEVFGDLLVSLVADREMSSSARAPNLLLLASAVRGPGALPISPSLCDLGPVVDTDTLSLASGSTASLESSTVSVSAWGDWRKTVNVVEDLGPVNEIAKRLGVSESLLWRKTLQCAFGRLNALHDRTPPTPLQSLVFGWLLPRAELSEVRADRVPPELREGLVDSREPDPRIARLLTRLARSEPS